MTLFPEKTWLDVAEKDRRAAIRVTLDGLMPDVVCINGWSIGGAIASLEWAIKNDRRVVMFSESNRTDHIRYKAIEKFKSRLVSLANAGLVGGGASREYLIELGMSEDRVFVGYDVVDNLHFANTHQDGCESTRPLIAPKVPYFVAAARFETKKNHIRLLRAYAKYRGTAGTDAWCLVLLGDGMLRAEIEAERDALGLGASLVLPGFAGYQDLPHWYHHAECFIHPSTTEQWGLVVNEAMASGLPVLVSDRCGCAPDLVRNGMNGFTFDPYDVDGLAKLMERVASRDCDLAAMGKASLEIIERWSPQTFASSLEAAVQATLGGLQRRAGLLDRLLLRALSCR